MATPPRIQIAGQPLASSPLVDPNTGVVSQPWSAYLARAPAAQMLQTAGGTAPPTWTAGTDAPSADAPIGALYSRIGGGIGTTLYVSRGGGTWLAVAGV
jgi:hypothetical protein